MVAAVATAALQPASGQEPADLFTAAPAPAASARGAEVEVVRSRAVRLDLDGLARTGAQAAAGAAGGRTLRLNLFDATVFTAVAERVEPTAAGYAWSGRLPDVEGGAAIFIVNGQVVSASITTPDAAYRVRWAGDGVHVIQEIDRSQFPPESAPIVPAPGAGGRAGIAPRSPGFNVDDGSMIDVAVFYTPAARTAEGGTAAIEALIDLGVTETNQAYQNSGAIQRIRLVRKEEISYTEAVSMLTDLTRLQTMGDNFLDGVHAVRDTYAADLVHLIVDSPEASCGIAYLMTSVSSTFESAAFGVTDYACVSPNYTFGHEMGHNMGLRHDTYIDPATTPYAYAHGYVNQAAFGMGAPTSARWRTVMAYNNQCVDSGGFNCTRLLYFSSPGNTYLGDPMGVMATADAVTALNNTRATVANFRDSATAVFTLLVTKTGSGTGTVTSNPAGVDCGGDCSESYLPGTMITLMAAPSPDSDFTSWGGDADCLDGSVTMSAQRSCSAKFTLKFTDETLTAGASVISATHITELRTRVNTVRVQCGLGAFNWMDPTLTVGGTAVRAVHVAELRSALAAAYAAPACSQTAPVYTDPALTAGSTAVKAVHIDELRAAVVALE